MMIIPAPLVGGAIITAWKRIKLKRYGFVRRKIAGRVGNAVNAKESQISRNQEI